MSLAEPELFCTSPRAHEIQKKAEEEFEKAWAEAAEEAVELVAMESSSEDEEQAGAPSLAKRKKQLEKEDDIKAAKKEVCGIIKKVRKVKTAEDIKAAKDEFTTVFAEMNDAVDHIAKQLAHWKRAARRASKELARIKRECSCGRAVNYPFILR
jgi:hypothetical protein